MNESKLPLIKFLLAPSRYLKRPGMSLRVTLYTTVVFLGLIIAVVLALAVPVYFAEPDDWTYYFAVRNFSQGQFTIDNQTRLQQINEARSQNGLLIQYVNIGYNKWALEKAPGYVFYLVPFQLLRVPRAGNVLLALGMVIVTYLLLKRLRDEKAAMIGSWLMLFTPLSLIMLNRAYIDTYASQAFLAIGGGLYMYYHLERDRLGPAKKGIWLFLAFFLISWSVVTRYTNLPVAMVLALHFIIIRALSWRKGEKAELKSELLPVVLAVALPAAALLLYDYFVFGSPLDYGYRHSQGDISFAFQYLGQVDANGRSIPLQIILDNLKTAPRPLLVAFPLLAVGVPGFLAVLYYKFRYLFRRAKAPGKTSAINSELPWDILLVLIGWFISVFFLYLTYEWTANSPGGAFFHFARFYLPGLFPVAVVCALVMSRFPFRLYIPALAVLGAFGVIIYLQTAAHLNILPGWIINGPQRFLPPPGIRPPFGPLPPSGPLRPPGINPPSVYPPGASPLPGLRPPGPSP